MMGYLRRLARGMLRRILEPFSISALTPQPALDGIDRKLAGHLGYRHGVFIEVGANDGYAQSNTYHLEFGLRWRGILIEAIPELSTRCARLRRRSLVLNLALSDLTRARLVTMHYANLMSLVEGTLPPPEQRRHLDAGIAVQHLPGSYQVRVPAIGLGRILGTLRPRRLDFLSIDFEGHELQVLRGTDLTRFRPRFILVETRQFHEVDRFLAASGYRLAEVITHIDYLYHDVRNRLPVWRRRPWFPADPAPG